jgi:hypothetical protein
MSYNIIAGVLGLDAQQSSNTYLRTVGTEAVYREVEAAVGMWNRQRDAMEAIFVGQTVENHTRRFYLPGAGRMQQMGFDPQTRPIARGVGGFWDVGFPLAEFADRVAASRTVYSYMTVADMDRHIAGVIATDANTTVNLILSAIFDNASWTYSDVTHGATAIQPLANGDAVVYPPKLGEDAGATANHYRATNYAASSISNTTDPFPGAVDLIERQFGIPTGGSPIIHFINGAQGAVVSALADFVPVTPNGIAPGDQTALVIGMPEGRMLPDRSRLLGMHAETASYIVRWDRIPPNYMYSTHMAAEPPLNRRVDPAGTGLSGALTSIVSDFNEPFYDMQWIRRVGYAVANRLNGVVTHFVASTTYAVPTGFTAAGNY